MNKTMRVEKGNYQILDDGSIKVILPEDELARSNSNTSSIKTIEEIVTIPSSSQYYAVASIDVTIEDVMNMFFTNRKLLCIILTKNGKMGETPVGILTSSDFMELNKIIENY